MGQPDPGFAESSTWRGLAHVAHKVIHSWRGQIEKVQGIMSLGVNAHAIPKFRVQLALLA
jgi:hypothetical protein